MKRPRPEAEKAKMAISLAEKPDVEATTPCDELRALGRAPGLRDLISVDNTYAHAEASAVPEAVFAGADRGPLLTKHIARRLIDYFAITEFVSFAPGISVALNPILFRYREYDAYVPPPLINRANLQDTAWIKPLNAFRPGKRTMIHWHPFCSNIDIAKKFLDEQAEPLAEAHITVSISDAIVLETGALLHDWTKGRAGLTVHWYSVAGGLTCVLEGVAAADLTALFQTLELGQRRDRFYRLFMAGRPSDAEVPTETELVRMAEMARAQLSATDFGLKLPATQISTTAEAIQFAQTLCQPEKNDGNTAMSWIETHIGRAKDIVTGPLNAANFAVWTAYIQLYCAANYAYGVHYFDDEPSETIDLLRAGKLAWENVRPRACYGPEGYEVFYTCNDQLNGGVPTAGIPSDTPQQVSQTLPSSDRRKPFSRPISMDKPTGHHGRAQFVIGHIRYIAAMVLAERGPDASFRWLDVGCGGGHITNAIDFTELGLKTYEVLGLDLGEDKIAEANRKATVNRRFLHQDLRTLPKEILASGFDLVTAFEVTEHLRDPAAFFKTCAGATRDFVMFGSPLHEPCGPFPAEEHTMSFSRIGFEGLIENAGLNVFSSNELRIGAYDVGHDWLTVVGRK